MIELSIIIPIYNLENFLNKCLDSVVEQKSKYNYEVICVNDGSIDSSREILEVYKEKHPNILRVFNRKNEGVSKARNFGISKAKGTYITFVDGDDWVSETMVNDCLDLLKKGNIDILISDTIHAFESLNIIEREEIEKFIFNTENHACGKVFKRELINRYKIWFPEDIKIGEDFTFTFSYILMSNMNYKKSEVPFYYYRRDRPGSAMSSKRSLQYKDIFKACEHLLQFSIQNNKYNVYNYEIEYLLIKNVLVRSLPKIVKNYFPNYFAIKNQIQELSNFMELHFPEWRQNRYFNHDIEGYFRKKLGLKYKHIIVDIISGKMQAFIHIILYKLSKK